MTDPVTVVVDGREIQTDQAGAECIKQLQQQLSDAGQAHADQLGELQRKLADAAAVPRQPAAPAPAYRPTAAVLSDAAIESRAQARADLLLDAQEIYKMDYRGKTDDEVRRLAITGRRGAELVRDATPEEVKGIFRTVLADLRKDPVIAALGDSRGRQTQVTDNGYAESVARLDFRTRQQQEA
ncbi:hypothetical protein [Pseudoxanthomonas winnipegensis]|uniref:Uncharacterized protein n=1 Tax=Pseudoxanthomonas winnipegensis TaxID=2480810 RepID=A0A4Q8LSW1_9GAMM|nr:hypothetical protein [Pseudoxanthomonas winnipegensis]RZZ84779.1 hypothetical protein EA663_13385 [Pseudoxanthomonas winnipegensis]TAA33720.1 hypothetical protein EA656_14880 [Pseudoxanthomonas winnipegensis]